MVISDSDVASRELLRTVVAPLVTPSGLRDLLLFIYSTMHRSRTYAIHRHVVDFYPGIYVARQLDGNQVSHWTGPLLQPVRTVLIWRIRSD